MYIYNDENGYNADENSSKKHEGSNFSFPVSYVPYNNYKPSRKKRRNIATYIALVLITSLVTSMSVGTILYAKFSNELQKQVSIMQASSALVKNTGVGSTDQNPGGSANQVLNRSIDSGSYVELSLPKGSAVTEIAKKVGPSIVGIRMTTAADQNTLFGMNTGESASEGSGIIISKDGYIMTNYHVVENADPRSDLSQDTTLEVFLPDKRQVKAKFIGGDKQNDLAVIKVALTNLPVVEFGDSSKLEVGELAVAIGNPLGLDFAGSVTVGVVSAINRSMTIGDQTLELIQTDAAINPGNSGGALVNSQGQVVGVNSAKISLTGVEGLGFAIPVNTARPIINQLIMFGRIKGRPAIGISGIEITQIMSQYYELPVGIYITGVATGGAAYNAGIARKDILVSLAGKAVKSIKDVNTIMKSYKAGDTVNAVIVRRGNNINLKITFTED